MKKTLLLTLLLCVSYLMNAQVSKTVNVTTAGGLFGLISTAEKTTITNLTVTGSIDASDVKFMRDDMTVLADINLAGANVMAFSGSDGTVPYDYTYVANKMPLCSFCNQNGYVGKVTLKNITLPNTLTSVGVEAFYGCTGLTSITLPNTNTLTSFEINAFRGCTSLMSITLPNAFASIGDGAFAGCTSLSSISLPNTLTSIGSGAFFNCPGLASINLPNSLISIGYGAFHDCTSLTSITLPNSVTTLNGGRTFLGCTSLMNITLPNTLTTIGYGTFEGCTSLTSITLPNTLTSFWGRTFYGCTGFTSITLPSTLTTIGYGAFEGCTGLTNITLPNTVTSLLGKTFYDCTGLTSITLSNALTSMGDADFQNCTGLKKIIVPCTVPPTILESTFQNVDKVTCELVVLTGKTSSYQAVDYWKLFGLISESNFATDVRLTLAQQVASVKVYVANQSIVVKGAPQGEGVAVYGLNGVLMQSEVSQGNDLMIPVDAGAIYLVKVGGQTFKMVL